MTAPAQRRTDLPATIIWGRAIGHLRRIARALPGGGMIPYLDRYSLRKQGESGTNEWRAYLHHFMAPDDEGVHNHPFAWSFSIVLRGSYTEEIQHIWGDSPWPSRHPRRVRWFNFIRADKYHRITELHPAKPGGGVWTLFFAGPLARRDNGTPLGWGFWLAGRGHVPWEVRDAERAAEAAQARGRCSTGNSAASRLATWARLASWRQN
jgi:hypothetical protein